MENFVKNDILDLSEISLKFKSMILELNLLRRDQVSDFKILTNFTFSPPYTFKRKTLKLTPLLSPKLLVYTNYNGFNHIRFHKIRPVDVLNVFFFCKINLLLLFFMFFF